MTLNPITRISRKSRLVPKFLSILSGIYVIIYIIDKIIIIESSLLLKIELSRQVFIET